MKKLLLFVLILLPMAAHASHLINGLYYDLDPTTKLATVTGYHTSSKSIVIPETITYFDNINYWTYKVIAIGFNAFKDCSATSVFLPNNVHDIGPCAFENSNLKYIHFSRGLTSVDDYAFSGCSNLEYVFCWYGPVVLGSNVFSGCTNLKKMYIAKYTKEEFTGTKNWSSYSDKFEEFFANGKCGTNLRYLMCGISKYTLVITKYVDTSQSDYTGQMKNYSNANDRYWNKYAGDITDIIVGDDVESIGNNAFADCDALTSITIPREIVSIGDYAFSNCSALTSLSIPNDVISIGQYAFYKCSNIKHLNISNKVTFIGKYAFSDCNSLLSVNIPDNIYFTCIAQGTFCNCINLAYANIPSYVVSIDDNAFSGCSSLARLSLDNSTSLRNIGAQAFYNCKELTSLTFPKSIESIGAQAFYYCDNIDRIKLFPETPPTASDNTFNNYNVRLYVPDKALTKYQNKSPWNCFTSIHPLSDYTYDIEVDGIYYLLNEAKGTAQVACQYTSASNQSAYIGGGSDSRILHV